MVANQHPLAVHSIKVDMYICSLYKGNNRTQLDDRNKATARVA
jgi:hypothetical protein